MADSTGKTCAECGYKALIRHDGYLVCEECGTINNEDMITSENQDVVGYQSASENKWIMSDKVKLFKHSEGRIPLGQKAAINQLKIYGKLFNYSQDMIDQAEHMYISLFHDVEVINKYMETKLYIASSCLFIVGRTSNHLMSIKEFTKITSVPIPKFMQILKFVKKKLSVELPATTVTEITVEIAVRHEIHKDVRQTALEIIFLCDRAWLVTGRNPQKLAWSAFYIAAKSLNVKDYKKVTFAKFLEKYNVVHNTCYGDRFREVIKVLTDLGSHIPWASNKGRRDFVFCNLSDIIRYSNMAFMEKKLELMKMMEDEKNTNECNSLSHKRKLDTENHHDFDILQPPALKYTKPTPMTDILNLTTVDLDCEIKEGSKIDRELDGYIRSDSEVLEISKARALIIDGGN